MQIIGEDQEEINPCPHTQTVVSVQLVPSREFGVFFCSSSVRNIPTLNLGRHETPLFDVGASEGSTGSPWEMN